MNDCACVFVRGVGDELRGVALSSLRECPEHCLDPDDGRRSMRERAAADVDEDRARVRRWVRRRIVNPLAQALMLAEGARVAYGPGHWEVTRASGDAECDGCGMAYRDHAADPMRPWAVVACDGRRLKL